MVFAGADGNADWEVSRITGNGELLPCTERSVEEIDRKERRKKKDIRMSELYRKKEKK